MHVSISQMIRRPISLGIALAGAFLIGVFVGSIGIPLIWRDEFVFLIGNATEHGCHNYFGLTPIRFGRATQFSDGSYTIPCDEMARFSDTVSLRCECPRQ